MAQLSGDLPQCEVSAVLLHATNKCARSLHFGLIKNTAHHKELNPQPWAYQQENSAARLPSQTQMHLSNLRVVEAPLHILSRKCAFSKHGRIGFQKDDEGHIQKGSSLWETQASFWQPRGDTRTTNRNVYNAQVFKIVHYTMSAVTSLLWHQKQRVVTPCLHPSCAIKWTGCTTRIPIMFIGSSFVGCISYHYQTYFIVFIVSLIWIKLEANSIFRWVR